MTRILVGTHDFRRGLKSVLPHAYTDGDLPALGRIRLDIGPENVTITATDRFTAAMSIVSVHAHLDTDGEETGLPWIATLDVAPADAKSMLNIFTAPKDKGDEPQYILRIEADENHVTVIDSSGLIDGHSLKVPRIGDTEAFPDLRELFKKHHGAASALIEDISVSGKYQSRFAVAASAYGNQGLRSRTTTASRAQFIECGESFLGLLFPIHVTEEDDAKHKEWHAAWTRRLSGPGIDLKTATGLYSVSDLETEKDT